MKTVPGTDWGTQVSVEWTETGKNIHGLSMMWNKTKKINTIFPSFRFLLEKAMAPNSSVLAWRIPGTGEPGGLPSMGPYRVGHDWSDLAARTPTEGMLCITFTGENWLLPLVRIKSLRTLSRKVLSCQVESLSKGLKPESYDSFPCLNCSSNNIELPYDPAIPLLSIDPKELKSRASSIRNVHSRFTTAKR